MYLRARRQENCLHAWRLKGFRETSFRNGEGSILDIFKGVSMHFVYGYSIAARPHLRLAKRIT